jgi:hypothetical protein
MTYPVAEWDQNDALLQNQSAASGLMIYRGTELPSLANLLIFTDMPSGEIFYVSADRLPPGGQAPIRRILLNANGAAKTALQVIQEKNAAQGKKPATRADLRINEGAGGRVFLLNKGDGTIRVLTAAPAPASSQARPDFSGQWIEAPAPAPAVAGAPPGRPDQGRLTAGNMGSGWGSPFTITQADGQFVVEQTLFTRYDLYPTQRQVYSLDGAERRNTVMIGHATHERVSRAAWDGQALRITTWYPGVDPESGKPFTTEVTYRLSLESPTTLVIETTRAGVLGGRATTTRTVFRKG